MQVQGAEQGRVTPAGDANETGASAIPPAEASQAAKTNATDAPAKPEAGEPALKTSSPKPVVEGSPLELARMQQAIRTITRDAQQLDTAYKGNVDNARGQGDGKISWEDIQSRIKTLPDGVLKSALQAIDHKTFKTLAGADRNVEIDRLGQGAAGPASPGANLKSAAQALSGDARSLDIAYKGHAPNARGEGDGKISWEDIQSRIKTLPDGALKSALQSIDRDDFKQLAGGKRNIEISALGRFTQPTPSAPPNPPASSPPKPVSGVPSKSSGVGHDVGTEGAATPAVALQGAGAGGTVKIGMLEINPKGEHAIATGDIAERTSVSAKDNVVALKADASGNPLGLGDLVTTLEKLAENPGDVKVVNLSLSSSPAAILQSARSRSGGAVTQDTLSGAAKMFSDAKRDFGERIGNALDTLNEKGVTVVMAAGNDVETENALKQAGLAVPAGFHESLFYGTTDRGNVIVVGASDREGPQAKPWVGSTPNANVDIAADGVDVPTLEIQDGKSITSYSTATSFAAPYVSGKIADMLQQYPELKPADVKSILKQAAFAGTGGLQTGAGVVDWALASQLAAKAAKRAS